MKRAIVVNAAVALTIGLAVGCPAPAAGQTLEADELVRVPSHGYDLDVEVWTARGEAATYAEGEEVKVRFRASHDCYVVIYDVDTDGFLHLLFPDNPRDDGFVEGGRIYSLPRHDERYTLVAEGPPGIEYIAAVASDYDIARHLPWYLSDAYESVGYRGHYDLEATVDEVGAVRGDPFVAMREIAYDILPEYCAEEEYDTDYTYFHVSREYSHPRYVCYDCHGRASWFDPYDDVCTVVDIRVDLDWHFVRHPTYFYVGPRFWYWRRHDCPPVYVGVPQFWCSLYPRHLFAHHFCFGISRIGLWYEKRGFWSPPARYHGRPMVWDTGFTGRYPDRPGYGKDPRHGITEKGHRSAGGRYSYSRGKAPPGNVPEVRPPQRMSKPDERNGGGSGLKSRTAVGRGGAGLEEKGAGSGEKKRGELRVKDSRGGEAERYRTGAKAIREPDSGSRKSAPRTPRVKEPAKSKAKLIKRGVLRRAKAASKEVNPKAEPNPRVKSPARGDGTGAKAKSSARGAKTSAKAKASKDSGGRKSKAKTPGKADGGGSKAKASSGAKSSSRGKVKSAAKDKGKTEAKQPSKARSSGQKSRTGRQSKKK